MNPPASLAQGLTVLATVVDRERRGQAALTVSRAAEITGIERSRASRVTHDLRRRGFLDRDEAGALAAGPAFFATAAARHEPWVRAARAELRGLAVQTGLTARLTAADGLRELLVRAEPVAGAHDVVARPGAVTPIWCTATGRALLWDHDSPALAALLSGAPFVGIGGPGAARTVEEVDERQRRDRAEGLITAVEEYVADVEEIALPLRAQGRIVAALGLGGAPFTAGRRRRAIALLGEAAERLSALASA